MSSPGPPPLWGTIRRHLFQPPSFSRTASSEARSSRTGPLASTTHRGPHARRNPCPHWRTQLQLVSPRLHQHSLGGQNLHLSVQNSVVGSTLPTNRCQSTQLIVRYTCCALRAHQCIHCPLRDLIESTFVHDANLLLGLTPRDGISAVRIAWADSNYFLFELIRTAPGIILVDVTVNERYY